MMVVVLLVSTILSAVAATEVVSSYQVAKDLTRRLDVGENCGPVISEMLNCFISNCLELSCSVQANVNTDTGLGCAEVTRGICTQLDDACCPPCSGVASKYLNCVVSTAFADDCPGASCDMVEGAPSPDTNITTTTTITGNTITTTTTTTTNTSSTTIVSNTTGSITSNSTMMEEDSEIEERVASSVVIDVEDKESDADNAYNSEKPVAASEKVPVKLNEETPDAAAIRTSNAYRSNHRHDVSSVAMFGVLLIALEFVRTM